MLVYACIGFHAAVTLSQAWAYATQVRNILDKNPKMKMNAFPMEVWKLHRKIHHRFLRFWTCFERATTNLQEMSATPLRDSDGDIPDNGADVEPASPAPEPVHVISLLSEESTTEDEDEGDSDNDMPTKEQLEACFATSGGSDTDED